MDTLFFQTTPLRKTLRGGWKNKLDRKPSSLEVISPSKEDDPKENRKTRFKSPGTSLGEPLIGRIHKKPEAWSHKLETP